MNWSGAKNWLIILFLGINLFLIFTLVKINTESSFIDKQTIEDTVAVLKKSNISIAPSTIPNSLPKLGVINVYNSVSDTDLTAKKILGENMNESADGVYSSGSKRLTFDGDMVYFTDSNPSDTLDALNADSAQSYVLKKLGEYGFNMDNTITSANADDKMYNVYITQKIDRYSLVDSFFSVSVSQKGIHSIEGSWFCPSGGQDMFSGDSARARSIITVLFEFVRDSVRESAGSNEIAVIDLVYTTGNKKTYHKHSTAMPMWRIRCSDNNEYYYDAR